MTSRPIHTGHDWFAEPRPRQRPDWQRANDGPLVEELSPRRGTIRLVLLLVAGFVCGLVPLAAVVPA